MFQFVASSVSGTLAGARPRRGPASLFIGCLVVGAVMGFLLLSPRGASAAPQDLDARAHCITYDWTPIFTPLAELIMVCRHQLCELVREDGAPLISGAFIGWLELDCRVEEPT